MQRVHLIYGILLLTLFLLTGYFMLSNFPGIYRDSPEMRMMFRANHIYILFASLINFSMAVSIRHAAYGIKKMTELFSSGLILIGGIILVLAFFIEPLSLSWDRPLTFSGVLLNLTGIIILVAHRLFNNQKMDFKNEK